MYFKHLSIAALASCAYAQTNSSAPGLAQALNSSSSLTTLNGLLAANSAFLGQLGGLTNITLLAPSNAAFAKVNNATLGALASNQGLITGLLQYHVLNGSYPASAISNVSSFIHTSLTNPLFTNVTGGQVVKAQSRSGNVTFFSGLLSNSTVSSTVNFTGGVVHIIDSLLVVPQIATDTFSAANLTSLRGAVNATGLTNTINTTPNITIFAPSNAAIQRIGAALTNLTTQQITDVLTYHVVPGLDYSSTLRNGSTLTTVSGKNLTIRVGSGGVFVNNARVTTADLLIANGVVHIIDEVLNPTNATIANSTGSSGVVAFSGATPASNVPFTSGQPTPTTMISPDATRAADPTQTVAKSSTAIAAPMKTGAVGMGAILGAAAVFLL